MPSFRELHAENNKVAITDACARIAEHAAAIPFQVRDNRPDLAADGVALIVHEAEDIKTRLVVLTGIIAAKKEEK